VRYRSFPVVGRLNGPDAMERAAVRAQGIENAAIVGSVRVRCPKRRGVPFCARPASRLQCSFGDTLRPRQGIGQARSVPISLRICKISRTRGTRRAAKDRFLWVRPRLAAERGPHSMRRSGMVTVTVVTIRDVNHRIR